MPQQWFTLGWVLSLIPGWLEQNGTLMIAGSYDDPNRVRTLTPRRRIVDCDVLGSDV